MKKSKSNLFKIIFSKNPNCSGGAVIGFFFFSLYCLIVNLLAPVAVSFFEFFVGRIGEELKERMKKYLKKLFLGAVLIYFFTFLLPALLLYFDFKMFFVEIVYAFGSVISLILFFLVASGMVVFLIFSWNPKRPLLAFIFEVFLICFVVYMLTWLNLFIDFSIFLKTNF